MPGSKHTTRLDLRNADLRSYKPADEATGGADAGGCCRNYDDGDPWGANNATGAGSHDERCNDVDHHTDDARTCIRI